MLFRLGTMCHKQGQCTAQKGFCLLRNPNCNSSINSNSIMLSVSRSSCCAYCTHTHTHTNPKNQQQKTKTKTKKTILEQKLCGLDAKISPPTNPVLLNLSTVRRKARLNISINCEMGLEELEWNKMEWNGISYTIKSWIFTNYEKGFRFLDYALTPVFRCLNPELNLEMSLLDVKI